MEYFCNIFCCNIPYQHHRAIPAVLGGTPLLSTTMKINLVSILIIATILSIFTLLGGFQPILDAVSRKVSLNEATLDFGQKMVDHLDLCIKMDGLPFEMGQIISVDDDQLVVRFPRMKSVSDKP